MPQARNEINQGEVEAEGATRQRHLPARPPLLLRMGRICRRFSSSTSVMALSTALLLSVVSEASVDTRSNRSENDPGQAHPPGEPESAVKQRWQRREIVVYLDDSLVALPDDAEKLIEQAFSTWQDSGAYLPSISFERTRGTTASLKPDGQSTVLVAPIGFEGHETDLAITIGFSSPTTGQISEADIIINQKHLFSDVSMSQVEPLISSANTSLDPYEQQSCMGSLDGKACGGKYDLKNVLTHEVGHFFGLGENYDDTRATMFSCTSACEIHKRDLNEADIEEINALYEDALLRDEAGCSMTQTGGHPDRLRLSSVGGWLLLVMAMGLRRRSLRNC